MVNIMEGLTPVSNDSELARELAQLVSSLMTVDNLELKSEVGNPLNLTRLKTMGAWAKQEGIGGVQQSIDQFIQDYLKFMVSKKRQGRLEVVKAISEFKAKMKQTLTGPREVLE